jgi:glycerol-1-phosphate dehydrogenase [NAD(P)+]
MPAPDTLAELLAGTYVDAATGEALGTAVRGISIGDDLAGSEAAWVASFALGKRLVVVSDVDTHRVLGERVCAALGGTFEVTSVVLPARPHADTATIDKLKLPECDAVIAVGSGTINDLCKMAALRAKVPQLTFATAPSMNGYTSVSASITEAGLKRSVRASAPLGVFFDLRVLAAAPVRMIRAGLGDSACRSTAQADWLLAHLLGVTSGQPYREAPFALLAADEAQLFAEPAALVAGDLAAMRSLVRTLVLSGCGMTIANGSFPASQGEHMLAHYAELVKPEDARDTFHGEQTGVTALVMAQLQGEILAHDKPPVMHATAIDHAGVLSHFGAAAGELCWAEFAPKRLDAAAAEARTALLAREWTAIRTRIEAIRVAGPVLRAALVAAGAPVSPNDLGWSPMDIAGAMRFARATRNRYTFLDLFGDTVARSQIS